MELRKCNIMERLSQIAYLLLCVILFDCMALGGGSYIKIFGIDIRMVYFGLFFLISLPVVCMNLRKLLTNRYFVILVLWGIWLIVSTVRGFLLNNRTDIIMIGLIGFASFGLLPGTLCVVTSKSRLLGLMKVSVVAGLAVSLQSLILLGIYNIYPEIINTANLWIIGKELGGLTIVDQSVIRVFLRSLPLLLLGCGSALYFSVKGTRRCRWFYCGCIALFLFSLLLSYTRSIYLGIVVCVAVLLVIACINLRKESLACMWKHIGISVGLFCALLIVMNLVFGGAFLNYGIYRTAGVDIREHISAYWERLNPSDSMDDSTGVATQPPDPTFETAPSDNTVETTESTLPSENTVSPIETTTPPTIEEPTAPPTTEETPTPPPENIPPEPDVNQLSDDIRQLTIDELYDRIREKPLLGSGMGAVLTVRENLDSLNEYFFLDQAFKTGLIGVTLFVLPMLLMLLQFLPRKKTKGSDLIFIQLVFFAALMGVAAFSSLNPYLNGSNGITLYCIAVAAMSLKSTEAQPIEPDIGDVKE